ncbi:MAG: hypothetical protein QOE80_3690, partial [Actinomycetota bacterium]|nr:hypothetical protein [Actinomycetota bacterium]
GADAATTLMEHLPPIGWADVAMKRDLDALEQRLDLRFDLRFDAIDQRFDAVDQRFETLGQHLDLRFGALEQRIDLRSEALEHKLMAAFRGELQTALTAQGRQLAITLAGTAGALSALAFAAARLT